MDTNISGNVNINGNVGNVEVKGNVNINKISFPEKGEIVPTDNTSDTDVDLDRDVKIARDVNIENLVINGDKRSEAEREKHFLPTASPENDIGLQNILQNLASKRNEYDDHVYFISVMFLSYLSLLVFLFGKKWIQESESEVGFDEKERVVPSKRIVESDVLEELIVSLVTDLYRSRKRNVEPTFKGRRRETESGFKLWRQSRNNLRIGFME